MINETDCHILLVIKGLTEAANALDDCVSQESSLMKKIAQIGDQDQA